MPRTVVFSLWFNCLMSWLYGYSQPRQWSSSVTTTCVSYWYVWTCISLVETHRGITTVGCGLFVRKAVARHPNPMELVVSSVCPEIIGHDFVKFGLTLALFGSICNSTTCHNGRVLTIDVCALCRGCTQVCRRG